MAEAEVTLDGPASVHDARRMSKRGFGTFERIFRNVVAVSRETALKLTVRCNVDRDNVRDVEPLVRALAGAGLVGRIGFYCAPIHSWGNDAHERGLSRAEYADWDIRWLALLAELGFDPALCPGRKKIVCLAVRRDGELIDAYGTSYTCTEVSYVKTYGEPNLYAIRLPGEQQRRPSGHAAALAGFNEAILSGDQKPCAECAMLPVCGGMCPKAWREGFEPCPPAKLNMPRRLQMIYEGWAARRTSAAAMVQPGETGRAAIEV